jgi:cysteinyl-tRNA synthetase
MKLSNTLTRQVEEIVPQQPPEVTIYTCGPTVYDYPHIGNWFTFLRYDLLVRTLKLSGLQPKWVINVTDVGHLTSDADEGEDKLEKGARREGKTAWDIARFYTEYFEDALDRLNITPPDYLPKATDHIQEQISLIKILEEKGYTYQIDDGIYYDTDKFPKYADFAQLDIDEQQAGKRVDFNSEKKNVSDFALWKFSPKNKTRDMEWDSPWGKGFPGWHLECSAMSMKYLGETLDIHAGGIDHLPVHHTNEIAQSEAATAQTFAHYWLHANHVTINDEKISKSLGNIVTLEDIENKGFTLDDFRLHVMESHYRSQSKFSWASLEASQNRLKRWQAIADKRFQMTNHSNETTNRLSEASSEFLLALEDDLDTPKALEIIEQYMESAEKLDITSENMQEFTEFFQNIDQSIGLQLLKSEDISSEQKRRIAERETARQNKDFAAADTLRGQLQEQGIGLNDTPGGAIWYRR